MANCIKARGEKSRDSTEQLMKVLKHYVENICKQDSAAN